MEDPLLTCPFEETHRISKSKMQYHLVKCAKNQSMDGRAKCPYNPLHIIIAAELLHHCRNCPDNGSVQFQQYSRGEKKCFSNVLSYEEVTKELAKSYPMNDNSVELQHGIEGPGYDPFAEIEKKPVMRFLNGESKSKREQFRKAERHRHANLIREQEIEKERSMPQPLRRPHDESVSFRVNNVLKTTQAPSKAEKESAINGVINHGHNEKEAKDIAIPTTSKISADDFDLEKEMKSLLINDNSAALYRELKALKKEKEDNKEQMKKIEEEKIIKIQDHERKIRELETHVKEQAQSIDKKNEMLKEREKELIQALINFSSNETTNDGTNTNSKISSTGESSITTSMKPKYNPKCAANIGPLSLSLSSENSNGVRQCGRGIVHAFNQTVDLPKIGRLPRHSDDDKKVNGK